MFEDILNWFNNIKDRWWRIESLKAKLRAVLFMDMMKKVEALCCDYHKELKERGVYPETYDDWKAIENDIVRTIDIELERTDDMKMKEELIGSKHFIKYMINIMLIHHLDFSKDIND